MHTCSLVPRPNTMITGLGTRLVHKQNHEMIMQMAGTVSFIRVGKFYEHRIGKVLHSAANLQLHTNK